MTDNIWLARWEYGQIGWHQATGNSALRKFWPQVSPGGRVLVPLCGKSPDLLWLAQQGFEVTGVELSELAIRAFFAETGLSFELEKVSGLLQFHCSEPNVTVVCGDYFRFSDVPFDALYDRAALVALPAPTRKPYVSHTKNLLKADAAQLLITLEYDQSKADGPPFSVPANEVKTHWGGLRRVAARNDIDNSPPRFRVAGIDEVIETVWVTA